MNKLLAMTTAALLGAVFASPTVHAQWSGIEGKQDNGNRESGSYEQPDNSRGRDERRRDYGQLNAPSQSQQQAAGGGSAANQAYGGQRHEGGRGGRDGRQYGGSRDNREFGGNRGGNADHRYGIGRGGRDHNQWDNNRYGNRHNNPWDNNRHGNRHNNHWDHNRHGGRHDHRYSRYYAPHRYRSSIHYVQPRGYRYSRWDVGAYLPYGYYGRPYYIDYRPYGLAPPPYGYQWVRVESDVYLVAISTGLVRDILYDLFY